MSPAGAGDGRAQQHSDRQAQGYGSAEAGKPEPLVPAITRHDRSIEDVAREKAMPAFEQRFEAVESVGRSVFRDPAEVAAVASARILDAAEEEPVDAAPDVPNNIATELLEILLTDEIMTPASVRIDYPPAHSGPSIAG